MSFLAARCFFSPGLAIRRLGRALAQPGWMLELILSRPHQPNGSAGIDRPQAGRASPQRHDPTALPKCASATSKVCSADRKAAPLGCRTTSAFQRRFSLEKQTAHLQTALLRQS